MPFGRPAAPPAAPNAGAPVPPPPPAPAMPPAPPAPPIQDVQVWVVENGASVQKALSACGHLPPTTPAMRVGDSAWSTLAALRPAAAPAPAHAAPAAHPAGSSPFARPAAPAAGGAPRGMFAGVENADITRRNDFIEEGDYVARLLSSEYKPGRQGNYVICELEIVVSSYNAADPTKQRCNMEGSRVSVFIKQNDSFASNIKEVMLAVSGFDEHGQPRPVDDVVSQQECEALVSPEQSFKGRLVYLEAREVPTRAGGKFTRVSWWPCPLKADGSPDTERLLREIR